jgi:hypothetical protein
VRFSGQMNPFAVAPADARDAEMAGDALAAY